MNIVLDQNMGANKSNETITRQWKILELVPARSPSKKGITTKQLLHKLICAGYDLNEKSGLRTIQRDMDTLSGLFPLESEKEGKAHYWYFLKPTNLIPSDVNMEDALAISLMKDYLGKSMPLSMSEHIHDKISRSIEKLSNSACSNFSEWYKKFRIIPNSFQLQAPSIRPKVLKAIQEALLNNKKIKITYDGIKTGRSTLYLCPLYLICKIEVFYLVACFKNK